MICALRVFFVPLCDPALNSQHNFSSQHCVTFESDSVLSAIL